MTILKTRRRAINIIMVSNAVMLSFLEAFIPVPIPIPGLKFGFANIIIMTAIVFLRFRDVLFIVLFRCLVMAILGSGLVMFVFSLAGGSLSVVVMWLLYKKMSESFSLKGISIAGAISHNTGQIIVASVLLNEIIILYYLPILLLTAIITGFINGKIANMVINELKKRNIFPL